MKLLMASILLAASGVNAQVVYKCANGYTDKPCKGGQELDIQATEGVHSYSGSKRQSSEAVIRDAHKQMDEATKKGVELYHTTQRCSVLSQERIAIDRKAKKSSQDEERRFQIRHEQFQLKCKNT